MTQDFAINRRQFLAGLVLGSLALTPRPLPDIPRPKFWFGQEVEIGWINDDSLDKFFYGQYVWMIGRVVGVVWNCEEMGSGFSRSWSYNVEFFKTHIALVSDVGSCSLVFESELRVPSSDQKLI